MLPEQSEKLTLLVGVKRFPALPLEQRGKSGFIGGGRSLHWFVVSLKCLAPRPATSE